MPYDMRYRKDKNMRPDGAFNIRTATGLNAPNSFSSNFSGQKMLEDNGMESRGLIDDEAYGYGGSGSAAPAATSPYSMRNPGAASYLAEENAVFDAARNDRAARNLEYDWMQGNPSSRLFSNGREGAGLSGTNPYDLKPSIPGMAAPASAPAMAAAPIGGEAYGPPSPYTVRPGDTLSGISESMGGGASKWRDLYGANRATVGNNPNMIRPGQKLAIPGYGDPAADPSQGAPADSAANSASGSPAPQTIKDFVISKFAKPEPPVRDIGREMGFNKQPFAETPEGFGQQMAIEGVKNDWRTQTAQIKADASIEAANVRAQALLQQKKPDGGLTEDAINGLAEYVKVTGTIPPLGMGAAAARDRQEIFNRAYAQGGGFTGADMADNQISFKSTQGEATAIKRQRGLAEVAEKRARYNLNVAEQMSDKVDRSGVPVINKFFLRASGKYAGDPDVAAFEAALMTAANEYAKVTTGSLGSAGLTDSARAEMEHVINTAQTPEQLKAVLTVMYQDMDNAMKAYDETADKRSKMGGGKSGSTTPTAPSIPEGVTPDMIKAELARRRGGK